MVSIKLPKVEVLVGVDNGDYYDLDSATIYKDYYFYIYIKVSIYYKLEKIIQSVLKLYSKY